jgi:transposase
MPAQYVKAYIKRNKHDAADAEAICEAVGRPTMRFVPVKTAEQQATQLLHRGREQLVRQRTMLVNALRAHLAEFGLVAAQGLRNVGGLIAGFSRQLNSGAAPTRWCETRRSSRTVHVCLRSGCSILRGA